MSESWSTEERRPIEEEVEVGPSANGNGPSVGGPSPAEALAAARVDLVELIERGIPEREYVPGAEPLLLRGKRYLLYSPSGVGKSLAALVLAVEVVRAGGTVAILDVENGGDEYARRLDGILAAKGAGADLKAACQRRLPYYAWPVLRVDWGAEEWAAAMAGADVVIFDSSRLTLSAAGLAENDNDDYAKFVGALLLPLTRAGATPLVLDNAGHDGDHARGASAKRDLNEVIYKLKVGEEFDLESAGYLRLIRERTRFPELPRECRLPIGGGVFGPLQEAEAAEFRPTVYMERISEALEVEPGLSTNGVEGAVEGRAKVLRLALQLLIEDGYVRVERQGQARKHFNVRLYRASEDPKVAEEEADA